MTAEEMLVAIGFGEVRTSARGVPHLVVETPRCKLSVTYFIRTGTYRVFWPYPASNQKRKDFKSTEEVHAFLEACGA